MMTSVRRFFVLFVAFLAFSGLHVSLVLAQEPAIYSNQERHHPSVARAGMVVSQNAIASRVGAGILARGGNAVDAAVAVGFALAVVLPRAGNLGGGGFMIVYLAAEDKTIAIDYRETAPGGASRDMFLDRAGNVDNNLTRHHHLSAGVPGTVAGLAGALRDYGTMSLAEVLAPAIRLAEDGIIMSFNMADGLRAQQSRMMQNPASARKFYKEGGELYEAGELFRQPDLARTLKLIARDGPSAFYEGPIADLIVRDMERNGGLISHEDLAGYRVVEREAVRGSYRGYEIVSMPPPSSGGIHLIQMLNILEHFPIGDWGPQSAEGLHVMAEAMRRAFADRSEHLGDIDFYEVPMDWLMSKTYAAELAATISRARATPSRRVRPGTPPAPESPDTTHFSVMDAAGNAVVNTYTMNFSFGSGRTVAGAGFLLNDEMDDFVAKPGVPNGFGLLGGDANAIEPGKRPLSSMTPTIVFRDGAPYLLLGSPGGSRIITTVLQVIVNVLDHRMGLADAVAAPRIHHQWMPDRLEFEPGLSPDTILMLEAKGHNIARAGAMGAVEAILYEDGLFYGAADPRRPDAGAVGICVAGAVMAC